jgi:hypothetical protein
MQTDSETAGDNTDQGGGADPKKEAAYWREQHGKQPYAANSSYEQFEHAYRTGYNSYLKHRGKKLEEIEDAIALDYE